MSIPWIPDALPSARATGPRVDIIREINATWKQFLASELKAAFLRYLTATIGNQIEYNKESVEKKIEAGAYPMKGKVSSIPKEATVLSSNSCLAFLTLTLTERLINSNNIIDIICPSQPLNAKCE